MLLSSCSIALVPTLAKLAYQSGSNPATVIALRSLVMVVATGLGIKLMGRGFAVEPRLRLFCLGIGVVFAVMSFGFLGSVATIPISLAVLIFFLHPVFVALAGPAIGEGRFSAVPLVAALLALLGLALALSAEFTRLDPRGLALAGVAAVTCAAVILANARAARHTSWFLVNFYMLVSTAVLTVVAVPLAGGLALPQSALGWGAAFGTAALFTIGLLTFFAALPMIGAVRATLISNIEPICGIGYAMLVFGERLTLRQALGAALVVASLFLVEVLPRRRST